MGHCSGGWLDGGDYNFLGCANLCKTTATCKYFIYDPNPPAGNTCEVYDAAHGCPYDGQLPNYTAFELRGPAATYFEDNIAGTVNTACTRSGNRGRDVWITCNGVKTFQKASTETTAGSVLNTCRQQIASGGVYEHKCYESLSFNCVEGYSPNWPDQVLYEELWNPQISEDACRVKCNDYGAIAYNWMDQNGYHGCRCYGVVTFQPTGVNWKFCTNLDKAGRRRLIDDSVLVAPTPGSEDAPQQNY